MTVSTIHQRLRDEHKLMVSNPRTRPSLLPAWMVSAMTHLADHDFLAAAWRSRGPHAHTPPQR
ncbi:hypothetical protein [Streptomyces sp. NPDC006668]|uniref:hypothetical protein n=1 Tax=Streptomyces sp. NPDC006668 TaxID=3156903 RepID=UPI0033EE5AED